MDVSACRLKVKRAEKHIEDLYAAIVQTHDDDPYVVVTEVDAAAQRRRWWCRHVPRYPPDLSLLAGDAVHNLRTALDHLACLAVGAPEAISRDTAFPVWRQERVPSANELKALVGGKIKGASQELSTLFHELEPYRGGNHSFVWELDRLDIIDKHRALVLLPASHQSVVIDFGALMSKRIGGVPSLKMGLRPADRCLVEENQELFSAPLDSNMHDHVEFTFDVAIGESGSLHGEPVVESLTNLAQAVEGLVTSFELTA